MGETCPFGRSETKDKCVIRSASRAGSRAERSEDFMLQQGELLLKTTDRSIKEISASCGITEVCLTDNFKKIYGTTPAKYRKANKTDTI